VCHDAAVSAYGRGIHGRLRAAGDANAPSCTDCHGTHDVLEHTVPPDASPPLQAAIRESPTFNRNVPTLCARCHRAGAAAAVRYFGPNDDVVEHYSMSIHGKGLISSGLTVTATCTDCHTAHMELPRDDPESTVNKKHIATTCGQCHDGIFEKHQHSVHSVEGNPGYEDRRVRGMPELPYCNDCHSAHSVVRTDVPEFMLGIMDQCGRCHEEVTRTYFDTYHGKASSLGDTTRAKCYDCHGAHDVRPPDDPKSSLSHANIVATCGRCHPGSHRQFAGYLTHATHHDRTKYPILFYTFWFMTILLLGTLTVAGIHTLLWLPRSFAAMKEHKQLREQSGGLQYRRFGRLPRRLHIMMIISFIGLALTGMTLKFSYLGWAVWLSRMLGGFESAGYIHRICAVITFTYFGMHIWDLFRQKRAKGLTWWQYLTGPNSMLPNMKDLRDVRDTFLWFIGMGPRPAYGRWTYWEKFDYFAVFWGIALIGSTGLLLWFPEISTRILPGWFINVATIIHSDEALLAVGFIFTVHFFNTHFRPDKFPMDTVIFTGRVPLEEFKLDRPEEYRRLVESGELEKHLVKPLPPLVVRSLKIFGATALAIGLILIALIIWAEVFGYR
jgi:cytochrome b subunit of formate dehydrogenase